MNEIAMSFFIDSQQVDQGTFDGAGGLFVLATPATAAAGARRGFTTDALLRTALSPYEDEVKKRLDALQGRAGSSAPDAEMLEDLQQAEVTAAMQRCLRALGKHGKTLAQIPDLLDDPQHPDRGYDPELGPAEHSVWLYGAQDFRGKVICLSGGWAYPDFSFFNFNNRAKSLIVNTAVLLFPGPGFAGNPYVGVGPLADRNLGSLRASSAVVW